jgi:hypothetical protein
MESLQTARAVLAWCTVLNLGLLVLASLAVTVVGGPIRQLHAKMFGLSEDDLSRAYFQYLAHYKIAIFVFNLAPYLALRIVG